MRLHVGYYLALSLLTFGCDEGTGVLQIKDDISPEGDVDTDTDADTDADTDSDSSLEPAGDYSVRGDWTSGTAKVEFSARGGNNLITNIWYPSTEVGSEQRVYGWVGWYNDGESFLDVAPDCSEPRPVMLYSHGNSGVNFEMFYLTEFLASHGWVVAGPDHTGNTAYDYTGDFFDLLSRRPYDIQDTFDWLVQQSLDPSNELYGCVDENAGYISAGFSFGGYTAYVNGGALVNSNFVPTLDYSDPRVWAVVTFAPWNAWGYLSSGTSEVDVPVLTIGGESDATVGTQYKDFYSHLVSTPRGMASFPNAGHFSYTPIYCQAWGNGCGPAFVDQDDFVVFVKTAVVAFAEHVRGRPNAIEQLPAEDGSFVWSYTEY